MNKQILLTLTLILLSSVQLFAQDTDTLDQNNTLTLGGGLVIDYKNPKEYEIGPIRIDGADNFDHNSIKLIAGLRQGQKITVPGDQVAKAIRNLYKEEIFSNITITAEREIAGVLYMAIKLTPRPKLSRFKFKGVNKREADKLREEITLFAGKTISENLIYTTETKIRGYFREKGYYSVNVKINRQIDTLINNSEIFVINIDKGSKVKIKSIELNGNASVSNFKAKMAMKDTKEFKLWRFFKKSKFNLTAYERDKQALLSKFNAIGLRDAAIVHDSVFLIDKKHLHIKIDIVEGEKYYFGNVTWIGNTKYRSTYLDTVFGIKYGDIYDKPLLDQRLFQSQDGRDITSLYMDRGYLFFQVVPVETNVTDNHINYEMRIMEGKEARIKDIIVKGNTKTNDYVVRREIRTKPGDLFSKNDIIRTQRDLAQLGYFNDQAIQIIPLPNPQDGTVDIEYIVEEKSSDQIELSGGYGGVGANGKGSIIGTLGLTFNNFSTKNFFKKGSWTPLPAGDGQRLSIRAQSNGRYYQSYNFSFTEPWLGGRKPNSLTVYASHTLISSTGNLKSNPTFAGASITGGGIGLGRRKKIPDDFFSAYYELGYQYYDIRNYNVFPVFADGKGFANDISLKYVLQRSSISAPIYPQGGSNLTFTAKSSAPYSLFDGVSDYSGYSDQEKNQFLEYYKLKFTGAWYFPLTKDKKLILSPRVGFGFLGSYSASKGVIPVERFNLGGSGLTGVGQLGGREIIALRGYDDNVLSSDGGDPLIAKYTLELRYPISLNPSATFFVTAFGEAGNTFPSVREFDPFNVKRSAGLGLRVYLPMFGMLGIDYGFGFDKVDAWATGFGGTGNADVTRKGYTGKLTFTIGANLGEL
jgi:outer membrane protein insertion porin family